MVEPGKVRQKKDVCWLHGYQMVGYEELMMLDHEHNEHAGEEGTPVRRLYSCVIKQESEYWKMPRTGFEYLLANHANKRAINDLYTQRM